jgi:hypothetical protein
MDIIVTSNHELTAAQIDSGIPYGLPFDEFLENLDAEIGLHNAGIWTLQDLYTHAQAAASALSVYKLRLSDVIRAAEAYEKQDHQTVLKATHPAAPKKNKKEKIP